MIAGRYEGVDERLVSASVDREVSIGDYVTSGRRVARDGADRLPREAASRAA